MTTTQILDKILPYTKEELKCARIRHEKTRARYQLMVEIDKMKALGLLNEFILKYFEGGIVKNQEVHYL